ncbi:hypothetical protein [Thalassomonas sp. M1454]|uniref:hypothetical protein n=1 Tax=Thalassomonas sp. M1454 TaxID=2594477 RepID=UPI00118093C7|nr:hypothetical protein [Thalassomonas sp. M1454]TRX54059.1 hypothetical protein FNN08_14020 [Thalassomonas sp. M1454]
MKPFKLFTLALTFLAFFSQAMVIGAECEMMANKNSVTVQSDMTHMGHNMAAQSHTDMDHSNHMMEADDATMANMQNHDMSDCCAQSCTCTVASCSSMVIVSDIYLPSIHLRAVDKLSLALFDISTPIAKSLYRPPITA